MFKLFKRHKPGRDLLTPQEREALARGLWPYRPTPEQIRATHEVAQQNDAEWRRVFGRD